MKLLILSNFIFFHNVFYVFFFLHCIKMSIYGGKELIGLTSFGFAQNMIHDFPNSVLNSVALSLTNATKLLLQHSGPHNKPVFFYYDPHSRHHLTLEKTIFF